MKTGTLLRKWSAALIAVVLMISLFAMPAFAEEATSGEQSTEGVTEASTEGATEGSTEASTEASTETSTEASTGSNSEEKEDDGKLGVGDIIGICIGAAIVVALVILGVKFRVQIAKYLRVLKSESKKIVWFPWDQTKKNSIVVLIVLIACAAAICLLDFALNKGFLAFIGLF